MPTVLASIPVPSGLAVDADDVYVASYEIGPVYAVAIQGGAVTELDTLSATTIAINSTSVFTLSPQGGDAPQGLIVSCAKTGCGGNYTVLASNQTAPWGIAADDANVYWTSAAGLMMEPVGGGAPALLAPGADSQVALGGGQAFYTGGTGATLYSVPVGGGTPKELVPPPSGGSVFAVATDCANVYYDATDGTLGRVPFAGGPSQLLAKDAIASLQIAVDDAYVYYASQSGISAVPVTGGAPQALVVGAGFNGIAVDATSLYWTTGSGSLMTMPKPGAPGGG
jgi:hypothetical protein